jgi:hypothetical protein
MSSFPTPITALKLLVSTGSAPNVQTFEESIPPSAISGMTGSHQINNPALISAFNSQSQGTIFNASIVTTYAPNTFPSGNIIPVPSVSNFVPNPIQASLSLATLPQLNPLSPPFSLNDYITKNSPAPLSFSSNNENVLTVSSSGLVTIQGAGQATITIAQPASTDGVYTAATSISRVVDVIPLPSLTWSDITKSVTTRVFPLIGDLAPSSNVPISYGNIWNLLGQDIDGEATFDLSGRSVSLSADGTIVAIGAPGNDGNGSFSGHVRVYKWNGTIWTQLGQDINGEAASDSGTSVSLSADGTIVAIGAPYNDRNGSDSGHVRVYKWNGTIWTQLGSDIDGEAANNYSGTSVSLSADGTIVAIGAHYNGGNGIYSYTGHVRVYKWNGTIWTQLGEDINGEANFDFSGKSVSLSADGTIVAIGAPDNDENGSGSGHVRVYKWNGTIWTQLGEDINGEAASDSSGRSVSLSADGTIVAIGAPNNDGNGSNSGHVRVYKWNGTIWTQLGQDINGEAANDYSGTSVSLSADGTIIAIGAPYNDGNGTSSGHVRVYKWNGTIWTQLGQDINGEAVNDYSGTSVSLSADGTIVAIGADYNGVNSSYNGHVRVYKIDIFGNFTYTSDTPAVADVFGNIVLLRSTGDTILTATRSSTSNYSSDTIDATLTVTS